MVKLLQLRTIDFEIHHEVLKLDGRSRIGISSQITEDDESDCLLGRIVFEIYKEDEGQKVAAISFRGGYALEVQSTYTDDEPFDAIYPVIIERVRETMKSLGYKPMEFPSLQQIKTNLQSNKDSAKDESLWS